VVLRHKVVAGGELRIRLPRTAAVAGRFVINIGDIMQWLTNDVYPGESGESAPGD